MTTQLDELLEQGDAAFRRGDAAASRRAFEAALELGETGATLEGLARARYLQVDYRGSIAAHERAFAAYRKDGDALGAARAARILSWSHANLFADWAVSNGWLARAQRVLTDAGEDTVEHGWLELLRANNESNAARRQEHMRSAHAIAKRFRDADLEFEAIGQLGLEHVFAGRVEDGMPLIDEALAAVCAGEVQDLFVIESLFCGMFWACERTHDLARAEQWIRAAHDMASRRSIAAIGAFCRAHYGSILAAVGRWSEAESELTEAARLFDHGYRAMRSDVLVRLADLRMRQGRFEEAALLLEGLDEHPDAKRPLAALHLARGDTVLALHVVERALADDDLGAAAAPFLALAVDAHLAAGALDQANNIAEQLAMLAERCPGEYLRASAAFARGKVCVARGSDDARTCLQEALGAFARAQMPLELARARLELARAVAAERPEVAVAEARTALAAFERLAAAHDADAAAALLRTFGVQTRTGPKRQANLTRRESEVLALLGRGLSNAEIGDRLYISGKTVEHHVGRVLRKLELRNRAEAAAFVTREVVDRIRG